MKYRILVFLTLASIAGFGQYKPYYWGNDADLYSTRWTVDSLEIDKSFVLYTRSLHRDAKDSSRTLYLNLEPRDTAGRKLVEVNYILVSTAKRIVLYVTLMTDKHEGYYDRAWLGYNKINIYDIGHLDFGKIDPNNNKLVNFTPKPKKKMADTWTIEIATQSIEIVNVLQRNTANNQTEQYNTRTTFALPMVFRKVANPELVFHSTGQPARGTVQTSDTISIKDSKLYILTQEDKYRVYFKMEAIIGTNANNGRKFDGIYFVDDRISFRPFLR